MRNETERPGIPVWWPALAILSLLLSIAWLAWELTGDPPAAIGGASIALLFGSIIIKTFSERARRR